MRHPRFVAEYVLVIAGDHVNAVGRPVGRAAARCLRASRIDGAVDQISRYRDQVHAKRVRARDDGTCPRCGKQAADVQIGQLQDRIAVE